MAFCRVGDGPIRTREPIVDPDVLVIQDSALLHVAGVFAGFTDGPVLVNPSRDITVPHGRLIAVPATEPAREHLGRPLPGAPLLGALDGVRSHTVLVALRRRSASSVVQLPKAPSRGGSAACAWPSRARSSR